MTFAIITEGASEHRVIKHILTKYFKEEDPDINQIQPKMVGEKQEGTGGWNEVLKYCEREELDEILKENDFLVIQIDTDQSQTKPFGVSHSAQDNSAKAVDVLHKDILAKLISLIRPEILQRHEGKILFAICIHTIECWLLPIYYTNKHQADTTNCLFSLNKMLGKKDMKSIPNNDKNSPQSIRTYEAVLKNWKRREDITEASTYNFGFEYFTNSLNGVGKTENNISQEGSTSTIK